MHILLLVLILLVLLFALLCSMECDTPYPFLIILFLGTAIGTFAYVQRPKTIDLNKDVFYRISVMEFEDGTTKQVSILKDGTTKHISSFSDKIYHEDSILREYKYIRKEKWIDFNGFLVRHYEVLTPNDERYKEAKEKVAKIDIIHN